MERTTTGRVTITRRIAAVVAVVAAVVVVAGTSPATARAATPSLASSVCGLASATPESGATQLIRLMKRRHVEVLSNRVAGTLDEYWCAAQLYLLQPILRQVVATKPSFRKRLGPFAFDLHVVTVAPGATADRVRAEWSEFNVSGTGRRTLYRRIGSADWVRVDGPDAVVPHGSFIQYAVRVRDGDGNRSPWNYSRQFTF